MNCHNCSTAFDPREKISGYKISSISYYISKFFWIFETDIISKMTCSCPQNAHLPGNRKNRARKYRRVPIPSVSNEGSRALRVSVWSASTCRTSCCLDWRWPSRSNIEHHEILSRVRNHFFLCSMKDLNITQWCCTIFGEYLGMNFEWLNKSYSKHTPFKIKVCKTAIFETRYAKENFLDA